MNNFDMAYTCAMLVFIVIGIIVSIWAGKDIKRMDREYEEYNISFYKSIGLCGMYLPKEPQVKRKWYKGGRKQ